ncbi:MAG: rhodanese-like domain-containing protein [Betaproteobacteria bacterium]|nr:rhodanese-like domain-containing protein [Betaproteobacteria bacterium]
MDHHDPEFLKRAAGTLVIDVRDPEEHAKGHVPGALNPPLEHLAQRIAEALPDKNAPVITYCNGGNRGGIGADTLQNLGYTQVFSIAGGFRAYQAATPNKES